MACLSGVAAAVPLWCSRFLPFQDAPQHLASIDILAGQGPAAQLTRRWFEISFVHAQYSGFYLPAMWLARLTGADFAIRLLLSLIALLMPLSAWTLLRSFGRDPRLSLFAAPLFHTAALYIGVYNFVAAVPVALLTIALVEQQLRSPSLPRGAAIALLAVLLLYLHLSGLVIALGAACALAATRPRPLARNFLHAFAPMAPALLLFAAWWQRAPPSHPVDVAFTSIREGPVWQSPLGQVRDLLRYGNVLPGRIDELAVFALAVIALLLWRSPGPRLARGDRWWRLPLLAAGLLGAYLVAPVDIGYIAYIHLRAIPFVIAFAVCSLPVPQTRRASALFGAAVAVQLLYDGHLTRVYRAFDREVNAPQLEEVLGAAAPGKRVVSLMLSRKSEVVHFEPYLHFGLYYEVLRGGRVRFNFGELPWMPVRFSGRAKSYPIYWEFNPGWFDWREARGDADYVLVRLPDPLGDAADSPEPGPPFADGWELQVHEGRWELFAPVRETAAQPSLPAGRAGRSAQTR